jgi:hypothetical protein
MPWLRIDALALLIVWYLPFWKAPKVNKSSQVLVATANSVSIG